MSDSPKMLQKMTTCRWNEFCVCPEKSPPDLFNSFFCFLQKMLCFNPSQRITANEALLHPYFSEYGFSPLSFSPSASSTSSRSMRTSDHSSTSDRSLDSSLTFSSHDESGSSSLADTSGTSSGKSWYLEWLFFYISGASQAPPRFSFRTCCAELRSMGTSDQLLTSDCSIRSSLTFSSHDESSSSSLADTSRTSSGKSWCRERLFL